MDRRGPIIIALMVPACGRIGFDTPDIRVTSPGACESAMFSVPPATTFADDFSTGVLADRWFTTASCIEQVGGELVATPPSSGDYCFAWTRGDHHLTCDSITVHVPEVTSPVLRVQTLIYVDSKTTGDRVNLLLEAGGFQLDSAFDSEPHDPVADAWWRLREHDGDLYFETAPDGLTWRSRLSEPTPFSLDDVEIALGAGTYQAVTTPGRARFHCYNVPPPCT